MDRAKLEINPPRDRLNLILLTFVLHGIGTLMPWNMFITAKSVSSNLAIIPANKGGVPLPSSPHPHFDGVLMKAKLCHCSILWITNLVKNIPE